MGEFKVHRVRFFEFFPEAIRSMSFNPRTDRLALVRANGSLEIYNFNDSYFQETVIPGNDGRAIEAICWVGERLFASSLNGEVIEYDLEDLRPKYTIDAYGGPVWAVCGNSQGTHLAVGCEDGTIKLFKILEDTIQFEKNLDKQKNRIISVSWHSSGTQISAGMMDTIQIFDVQTGRTVHRLLVGRVARAAKVMEVVVWAVVFLSDHTVFSGDSSGRVQIWDGLTGTLVSSHSITKHDVTALSLSQDERSLIAGTSEGCVVQFQFISPLLDQPEQKQWVKTKTFKNHTHDIRAVAHTETAVVSGGVDPTLVVKPLLEKVEKHTRESAERKIFFPHRSLVCCAKKAGILLFQFSDHLELWRLGESQGHGNPGSSLPVKTNPEKLVHVKRKGDDQICCSTISPCGGWLAYSTVSSVRLYRLQYDDDSVSITKAGKMPKGLRSAHHLCFSADSTKLFVSSTHSSVFVMSLSQSECKHELTLRPKSESRQPVHLMSVSEDGRWLATANTGRQVHVYNLNKLKFHCTLPVYSSCPTALAIHPTNGNLLTLHANQQMFEYSLEQKEYSDWSRKLQSKGVHAYWLMRDTPITHASFSPSNPSQILLHDNYMFCILDQTQRLPDQCTTLHNQNILKNLSASERSKQRHAFKICRAFTDILYVGLLEDGSLVVVERPLLDIVSQLPAPIQQKKFAT